MIAAELAALSQATTSHSSTILTVAMGDLVTDALITALGSPVIKAALGRALANVFRGHNPGSSAAQVKAIQFAETTMSMVGTHACIVGEMMQARKTIIMRLRSEPPSANEINMVFNAVWNKVKTCGPSAN